MSGPKVSVYVMSAEQRKNLRAQLDCLQQSLVFHDEIKKSVKYLNSVNGQIQSLLSTFELVNQHISDCSPEISILTDLQAVLPQECQTFVEELACTPIIQVDRFTLSDYELTKRMDTLAKLRTLRNMTNARQKEIEATLAPMEDKAKQGVANVGNAIADDIAGVQSFFIASAESENDEFESNKKKVEARLHSLIISTTCPSELKNEARSALSAISGMHSKEQLSIFKAVTIRPLESRRN
jgi:hypothetical protein